MFPHKLIYMNTVKGFDLAASFQTLLNHNFIRLHGCLVEKTATGYTRGNKRFKDLDEVEKAISAAQTTLQNSIKTAA